MSTITLHGVDPEVDRRIREIARREKASINRTTQALLQRALGLTGRGTDHRADFADLVGRWSESDLAEFEAATSAFSRIDPSDWE